MRIGVGVGPFYASTRVNGRGCAPGCLIAFAALPLVGVLVYVVVIAGQAISRINVVVDPVLVVRVAAVTAVVLGWLIAGGVWLVRRRKAAAKTIQDDDEPDPYCGVGASDRDGTHAEGRHVCGAPAGHDDYHHHACACGKVWA